MTTPTVVVTGASTGIGRAVVTLLADRGARVVAAVRDLSTAPEHDLVTPVLLDVTSADEARAAAEVVAGLVGDAGLHGLVNNAGIAVGGPLEHVALDELRRQLEVNVVGQVAVTQAFLPLLRRRGRGARIVFTGSVSGRVGLPMVGPYAASKHALHGLAESWRRELRPFGIGVSVLAPGAVSTPIWAKAGADVDQVVAGLPADAREHYGDVIDGMRAYVSGADDAGIAPERVARAAHHALFSRRPKAEYLLGNDARAATLSWAMPYRALDALIDRQMRR
jgi:NAD(P)-dependent dehydrogenase (short-subunit alcohol dehydrogenase family)